MSQVSVSVIVPVYNSEDYLRSAIDSLLGQEFENYEILLIDDGSVDCSGDICDVLAKEFPDKVKVFHNSNSGMCGARNYALSKAQGEYITFMDNDDECLPGFLKDNYLLAKESNADCVRFGRTQEIISPFGKIVSTNVLLPPSKKILKHKEIFANYRDLRANGNGVWSGMYKASFLHSFNIEFDERLRHGNEDTLFNLAVYRHAEIIALNPNSYYVWKQRMSHSSSMSFPDDFFLGIELALEEEISLMESNSVQDTDMEFVAAKLGMYLREALSVFCRSSNRIPMNKAHAVFDVIQAIFSKATIMGYKSKLSISNKIMMWLLLKGHYRILYLVLNIGYFLTNRQAACAARSSYLLKAVENE